MSKAIAVNPFRYYYVDDMTPTTYTYTGWHEWIDDGNGNWRIKLKSSGVFVPLIDTVIDVFLVGGGAGGGQRNGDSAIGGGGGCTETHKEIELSQGKEYPILIGAGGVAGSFGNITTAFGEDANGGAPNGCGGSGGGQGWPGNGGSDGANGSGAVNNLGIGQGSTTREFGELAGGLYSGGGGGTANPPYMNSYRDWFSIGGAGGGGRGTSFWEKPGVPQESLYGGPGVANTGGGGGAAMHSHLSGAGGSGIVVIRNSERNR